MKRLPVDELKIDRAFITDVARGGRDGALAAAVVTLGSELDQGGRSGGDRGAVGVPDRPRLCAAKGLSRPVPQAAFEKMLKMRATRPTEARATA